MIFADFEYRNPLVRIEAQHFDPDYFVVAIEVDVYFTAPVRLGSCNRELREAQVGRVARISGPLNLVQFTDHVCGETSSEVTVHTKYSSAATSSNVTRIRR